VANADTGSAGRSASAAGLHSETGWTGLPSHGRRGASREQPGHLPDAPWPVAARNLLSPREQSLYQRLLSLYPKHQVFVQVALSQLIDIDQVRFWFDGAICDNGPLTAALGS
jgi:hypothetical protein